MRVISRITAISRGLFTNRITSRMGSRSRRSAPGAIARTRRDERRLSRGPAVPWVGGGGHGMRHGLACRATAAHFGAKRGVDRPALLCHPRHRRAPAPPWARPHRCRSAGRLVAWPAIRPVVPLSPWRLQVQRRLFRAPVEDQGRTRHLDAGEIKNGCSETRLPPHISGVPWSTATSSPMAEITRARRCGELLEWEDIGEIYRRCPVDARQPERTDQHDRGKPQHR